MPTLHLRPYQKEAIGAVERDWRQHPDVLGVLPTGGGKTQVFLQLLTQSIDGSDRRGLVLAHREELIDQPLERLSRFWPDWASRSGAVQAERDECDRALTVACVPTLVKPERLRRLLEHGPIDYLVVDESQHSVASQYLTIWQALREANPQLRHLGVTATPIRTDRRGLVQVYKHVSFRYTIQDLQRQGYLVPVEFRTVETGISLASVGDEGSDFEAKALARAWECQNLFELVVESHRRWTAGRQAMAFTASVEGAHALAEAFRRAGIRADSADGTTARRKRESILRAFRAGDVEVLCNCFLYTEGLDVPEISAIHWVRPTKSQLVVTQGVGRALRPAPGKENAVVLFYSPVEIAGLATPGDILGEEQRVGAGGTVEEEEAGEGRGERAKLLRGDKERLLARPIELLPASPLAWHYQEGLSTLTLGEVRGIRRTLAILPHKREGEYVLVAVIGKRGQRDEVAELGRSSEFEEVTEQGAGYAETYGAQSIFARDRSWDAAPASDKQLAWLSKLGIPFGDPRRLTSGEASKLLTHTFAARTLRRSGWTWSRPTSRPQTSKAS